MIDKQIEKIIKDSEEKLIESFKEIDEVSLFNTEKVLKAFKKHSIALRHFSPSNGYGYDDIGRDTLERTFSSIFNTESTILRPLIASGTHALSLCLFGILKYGDELISATGEPYDTLQTVIGHKNYIEGSLVDGGIFYKEIKLNGEEKIDVINVCKAINSKTKIIMVQRSRGYSSRRAILPKEIQELVIEAKKIKKDVIIMVDNCYGEFVCKNEPSDCGADIIVGSLIKNPGGGIAPTGGYISGKSNYIDRIATKMTAPGLGKEIGSYESSYRPFYQGIFMAPHTVAQALKTACLLREVFNNLGFETIPNSDSSRSDIVQIIVMKNPNAIRHFCEAVQYSSPVDSFLTPEPWDMPGYDNKIIMASGSFVAGSSIEISADAPIREPYNVYFQGGLTYEHGKYTIKTILKHLNEKKCINICN